MNAPDLILHNGKIATLDPLAPEASGVAIRDGRFCEVGDDRAVLKHADPKATIIDLKGAYRHSRSERLPHPRIEKKGDDCNE